MYTVNFTETNNPDKAPITVVDQVLNKETSLSFPGNKYYNYPPVIGENLLHLLENFARDTAPGTISGEGLPVQGQLWYDNGNNILKVFDGISWKEASGIKVSSTTPTGVLGDLWVNTTTKQLNLYSGSNWIVVGPQSTGSGSQTGIEIVSVNDTSLPVAIPHDIVKIISEDRIIGIVSKTQFTPKTAISGFPIIYQGITLSNIDKSNVSAPIKFWGVASEADSLRVNNNAIPGSKFLRSDQANTVSAAFTINSDGGLNIRDFNIASLSSQSKVQFLSSNPGNAVEFTLRKSDNSGSTSVLYLDSRGRIGVNNYNPLVALDVGGDIRATSIDLSSTSSTISLNTTGGITVAKEAIIGGKITSSGTIIVNNKNGTVPIIGAIIEPGDTNSSEKYDIGSTTKRFRYVYANKFYGDLQGTFSGNVDGNITGSANHLAQTNIFRIRGDITSSPTDQAFNGVTETGEVVFTTILTPTAISDRTSITRSLSSDELLLNRIGVGLVKQTQNDFVSSIGVIPIGGIVPYLGIITTDNDIPPRFQLCDGREISKTMYPELFLKFRYEYSTVISGDLFKLPDLRNSFGVYPSINYIVYTGVLA